MAMLLPQFQDALKNIEPSKEDKENAQEAHGEVRRVLEQDETLLGYEIDTVLIGSYRRHVSIRRMQDVDVFSKLPGLPADVTPRDLHQTFVDVLTDGLDGERVVPGNRSVQVKFPNFDLYVDVVPARPREGHWEIPDRTDRTGGWQETNPERLVELTSDMNEDHADLYVPTVKLVRQTRRTHIGQGKEPSGHYLEVLTFHAFASGAAGGSNIAEYFCSALSGIVAQLEAATENGLEDPTIDGATIVTRASTAELRSALDTFASVAEQANGALANSDRCAAAKVFRDLLGRNSAGGLVFPMPGDCNEDGTPKSVNVIAGERHIPAGDRRFALS
jgi:hypothetical protein